MDKLNCLRCGHVWKRRGKKRPKRCPSCTNSNWGLKKNEDIINLIING